MQRFQNSEKWERDLEEGFRVPEGGSKLERWLTAPGSSISMVSLAATVCVWKEITYWKHQGKVWLQSSAPKINRNETKDFMGWKQPGVLETSFLDFLLSDVLSTALKSNKTAIFIPRE